MVREEGHYTIQRVGTLPKKGNSNLLYALKSTELEKFYRWLPNNTYEVINVGSGGSTAYLPLAGGTMSGDIVLPSGTVIKNSETTSALRLRPPWSNSAFDLTTDNGAYSATSCFLYGQKLSGIQLGYQVSTEEAIGVSVIASGLEVILANPKEIVIMDNTTGAGLSGTIDKRAVFVGAKSSTISTGIVNTAVVGGESITATVSNALYTNELRLQSAANSFDGIFDIGVISANRTYSMPNASGTVSLDKSVLADTTTAYNFVLSDGNNIVTLNNAAATTAILPAESNINYPIGTKIDIINLGVGVVTVSVTTDVINQGIGGLTLAQYERRVVTKVAAATWILG